VGVALDGDGGGEAWDRDGTVELRERVLYALAEPVVGDEGANDNDEDHERGESDDDAPEDAAAFGLQRGFFGGEGFVGDYVGVGEMGQIHGLIASVNGAECGCEMVTSVSIAI
jgi:hypothetical protein